MQETIEDNPVRIVSRTVPDGADGGRSRYNYLEFYRRALGRDIYEAKYPWFVTLCPFHNDTKTPNLRINVVNGGYRCFACFKEGNLVLTSKGWQDIKEIQIGDLVLVSNNKYEKVLATMSREYQGDIHTLQVGGIHIQGVTPTHKIPVLSSNMCVKKGRASRLCLFCNLKYCSYKHLREPVLIEKEVKDIKAGDFIEYLTPPKNEEVTRILPYIELYNLKVDERLAKRIPAEITIDYNFIKLVAWFITEGCWSKSSRGLTFTLHSRELDIATFLQNYISTVMQVHCRIYQRPEHTRIDVVCCSKYLGELLAHLCGRGASNKKIPDFILTLSKEKQEFFINELCAGDGYIVSEKMKGYKTISKVLRTQLVNLLISLGKQTTTTEEMEKEGHKRSYTIRFGDNIKSSARVNYNGRNYLRVGYNKISNYSGLVYNLTVENEHKYNVFGFKVNNCGTAGSHYDLVLQQSPSGHPLITLPNVLSDASQIEQIANYERSAEHAKENLELNLLIEQNRADNAHKFLFKQPYAVNKLTVDRGLTLDSINRWKLGFMQGTVTIPIPDINGKLANLKFHKQSSTDYCKNQLFPWEAVLLEKNTVVNLVEGEFDMMIARQYGFNAVTQTFGASTWSEEFSPFFRNKTVFIAYDNDKPGKDAAITVGRALWKLRCAVYVVNWPPFMGEKEDHVDFFVKHKQTAADYAKLAKSATSIINI